IYYDMPPNYIWAKRGGSSKISAGEKHSMRMTAVLTARADGQKFPIMFIMKELGSQLCPLPPNATSFCQPLDVVVMAPFKRNMREHWLYEEMIEGDDDDPSSLTSKLKRMALIKRAIAAWDMVPSEVIRTSFDKAIPRQQSSQT
ncbi:hypothetical protein DYB32_009188, partial [Aphanomyces invadans]